MTFLDFVLSLAVPELALAEERWQDALQEAQTYEQSFHERGIAFVRPDLQMFAGAAKLGMGQLEAAQADLETARDLMEQIGSQRSLWRVLGLLAHIARMNGDKSREKDLRSKAKSVIDHIAKHCPTPELRDSFLQRTEVRAAIKGATSE